MSARGASLRRFANIRTEHYASEPYQLGKRPGLERATARRVRRLRIGDLGDVTQAGVIEMLQQRRQKPRLCFSYGVVGPAVNSQPGSTNGPISHGQTVPWW